jgi:hypothetical protein
MAPPGPATSDEDLVRFSEFVAEGWAFAATSRRRAGFGVARAVEDAEQLRQVAVATLGPPRLTVLHGQSFGGAIAARAIEAPNEPDAEGRRPWDAALLTSAVLAGPSRAYDMRVDLRAAFQAVCGTHPRPDEPAYHLGIGLPPESPLTTAELRARFDACTGANRPAAERTPEQARALADLAAASRIPEGALFGHLTWMTFTARDLAQFLTGGRPAFGNTGVTYRGTSDDAAFNARVPRFAADPAAVAALAADTEPTGRFEIPVLSMHAIRDSVVFVENQSVFRETVAQAGNAARLVQAFVDESDHSKVSQPHYPALMALLRAWVETGARPDPAALPALCEAARAAHPGECRFRPGFEPGALEARVNPR